MLIASVNYNIHHYICCEGESFSNPCLEEIAGIACTADSRHVCCNGEYIYDGFDDTANNDECTKGECDYGCVCAMEMNHICGDGKPHPNPCDAKCDGIPETAEEQSTISMYIS